MKLDSCLPGLTENPLKNEDDHASWRPWITRIAGEPVSGTVSSELFGFSRILDNPGPPTDTAVRVFQGILRHSEPKKGRLHRECGRVAIWLALHALDWTVEVESG